MRRTSLLTATAAAVLALAPPPAAALPAATAAVVMPVLTGVSLSAGAVSVSGLDVVPVTVTVTTTGDAGPCSGNVGGVGFYRTSTVWDRSAPFQLGGPLSCVSDSDGVRTYRAVVPVTSTAHGSWRFSYVSLAGAPYDLEPETSGLPAPGLTVTGSHRPLLRFALTPQPLPYPGRAVTLTVRATFDDTGAPVVGQFISVAYDTTTACSGCSGSTDAGGRLVRKVTVPGHAQLLAHTPVDPSRPDSPDYSSISKMMTVQPALVASPARSSTRHGTDVAVNGRAFLVGIQDWAFKPRAQVVLQRLVGRHWRTVDWDNGGVRPTGRFTLVATPPKGRNYYRVSMPAQQNAEPLQNYAGATSRIFVIRGT
jgi:hypothetical protein